MKILIVTPYFYPKIGGMENYAYNIALGLIKSFRWEVVVITSNHVNNEYMEETLNGIKIYRLSTLFKVSNTPINPLWYFKIKKIIEKERPDVINGHTPVPYISDIAIMASGKIPYVLTYQNDLVKENFILNFVTKIYYFILGNTTLKKSIKVIATSKYYLRSSPHLSAHRRKIDIIPPGVDMDRFNLNVNKSYLSKKYGERPKILFVGQLDKTHNHKGVYYLMDAIAIVKNEFKDILLVLVGNGDNITSYFKYAKKISIDKNIIIANAVNNRDLPKYYAGSNITVLPSYSNSEGFGMVLLEAGACGKPVIGTKVGGIPYAIVDQLTGLLVAPKDSESLANAMIRILKDPLLAAYMSKAGNKRVNDKFTWNIQVHKTHNLLKKLI